MGQSSQGSPLSLPTVEQIVSELEDIAPEAQAGAEFEVDDPELERMAAAFVDEVLAGEDAALHRQRRAVDEMGLELQRQAAGGSPQRDAADATAQAGPSGR